MIRSLLLAAALLGQSPSEPGLTFGVGADVMYTSEFRWTLGPDGKFRPAGVIIATSNGRYQYALVFEAIVPPSPYPGPLPPIPPPGPTPGPTPTPTPAPTPTPVPVPASTKLYAIIVYDPDAIDTASLDLAAVWRDADSLNAGLNPLNVEWRAWPKAYPKIAELGLAPLVSTVPCLLIYEGGGGFYGLDGAKLPAPKSVAVPKTRDEFVKAFRKMRGQ